MSGTNEELKVKDLLIKLQVLTNGLIEERKKSQNYLLRIKEYEESLQRREVEIAELTKEKFDLKSKLSLERSKTWGSWSKDNKSIINSKMSNELKIQKLEEKINQQNFELKDYAQRIMEDKELFDQQKIQLQTMITIQNQQMAQLKEKITNLEKELKEEKEGKQNNEKNEINKEEKNKNEKKEKDRIEKEKKEREEKERKEKEEKEKKEREEKEKKEKMEKEKKEKKEDNQDNIQEIVTRLNRKFDLERDDYGRQIGKLKEELREEKEKNEILNGKVNTYTSLNETLRLENKTMKDQITILNNELQTIKNQMYDKQLDQRIFQVERIKSKGLVKKKQAMTITFKWNKTNNRCEVYFKRLQHNGQVKEDMVNILDITYKRDKKNEYLDFIFTVSKYLFNNYIFIVLV